MCGATYSKQTFAIVTCQTSNVFGMMNVYSKFSLAKRCIHCIHSGGKVTRPQSLSNNHSLKHVP